MTGQKDRYSTTEKLWNLDDKQLTTPKHDELVLNATPKFILTRLPDILKEIQTQDKWVWNFDKKQIDDDEAEQRACRTFSEKYNRYPLTHDYSDYGFPPYRKTEYHSKKDNPQYKSDSEQISEMTRIEIAKSITTTEDSIKYNDFLKTYDFSKTCKCFYEVPITGHNQFIIGYWDIVLRVDTPIEFKCDKFRYEIKFSGAPITVYIEAKPIIESFGGVIRQIKTYMEYLNRGDRYSQPGVSIVCLLTPDARFKSAFESQGIRVIQP